MRAAVMEAVRKPLIVKEMPDPKCPADGVILRSEVTHKFGYYGHVT